MNILIQFEKIPLFFRKPETIVCCKNPLKLPEAFRQMEKLSAEGFYLAGFFSYEAGYCFEKSLHQDKEYAFPLLLMGAYRRPEPSSFKVSPAAEFCVKDFLLNTSRSDYEVKINRIRDHIARGDVYQITYCIKLRFSFSGDAQKLYAQLLQRQPVPYPAYLETEEYKILSLSPERFMRKRNHRLVVEPMKGTWPRGSHFLSDTAARIRFSHDKKNRAENVMIADLLRNDLGRIGSNIKAPKLFTVTPYKTLYQMTSTVTGVLSKEKSFFDIFAALFPSGSVTGAPKIRAMNIIRELEAEERKIYTGAIGYITPSRDFYFNIPIRTLLIQGHGGEMGVGGGIVWDSTPQGEWEEGLLKARFLTDFSSNGFFS
ncbi:MAG: aminodeoxychorismate synthase component I [Candidatus Omnitrophota bacterium]